MPTVTTTVHIARPVDEVFAFMRDLRNWPSFVGGLRSVDVDGPVTLGTRGVFHRGEGTQAVALAFEVTDFAMGERIVVQAAGAAMRVRSELRFAAIGDGTRLTNPFYVRPRGWRRLLGPLNVPAMRKDERRTFANLKSLLEGVPS